MSLATTTDRPTTVHPADQHDRIRVQGARVNNLKDISVEIPKASSTLIAGSFRRSGETTPTDHGHVPQRPGGHLWTSIHNPQIPSVTPSQRHVPQHPPNSHGRRPPTASAGTKLTPTEGGPPWGDGRRWQGGSRFTPADTAASAGRPPAPTRSSAGASGHGSATPHTPCHH